MIVSCVERDKADVETVSNLFKYLEFFYTIL